MKSREALHVLAEISESQWGMITSAQAKARGISPMNLTRLTESGDLIRLSQGVYRDAGVPASEHEGLRAAWLSIEPAKLAFERLAEHPGNAVASGESASTLLGIGDLRAAQYEFTTPRRRQTQRSDIRYRIRTLPERDITVRDGLPVTTRERTIADLVEDRQDLSIVGNVLRDAAKQSRLDLDRLTKLLSPLAERNGCHKGDGNALLDRLTRIAGINLDDLVERITSNAGLGTLVTAKYLDNLAKNVALLTTASDSLARLKTVNLTPDQIETTTNTLSMLGRAISSSAVDDHTRLTEQLNAVDWTALAQAAQQLRKSEAS